MVLGLAVVLAVGLWLVMQAAADRREAQREVDLAAIYPETQGRAPVMPGASDPKAPR